MPKLKTNRAAAKRFRKTAKGFKRYSVASPPQPRRQSPASRSASCVRAAQRSCTRPMSIASCSCFRIRKISPRKRATPYVAKAEAKVGCSEVIELSRGDSMARVKRGVTAGRRHKKVLAKAKGYYNARRKVYRAAKQAVIKAGQYAYPRPPREEARVPRAVDRAHQCGRARARPVLQPAHQRPERRPASRSIARCWPTSRCTTRRRLAPSRSRRRPRSSKAA